MSESIARRWCRVILAINLVAGLTLALSAAGSLNLTESQLPRFEQSAPDIPDWPGSHLAEPHA